MSKRALIIGVSGQDGCYLARHLLAQNYDVIGLSRDAELNRFSGLLYLGIKDQITLDSISTTDFRSVAQVFQRYKPDEVYNLSGQSSVGLSFSQPVETIDSHLQATIIILEVIKFLDAPIKFYNASSSECFGESSIQNPADEQTPFRPRSPYALGKAAAFWAVDNYREAYGLFACSGILGNHESPLRSSRFVTQKIIEAAANIQAGRQDVLLLGNTDIVRDWGWAEEYVVAMNSMLNLETPTDFVIATGSSCSLWKFAELAFTEYGLEAKKHIQVNPSLMRPTDIRNSYLSPDKAAEKLNWKAHFDTNSVVRMLIEEFNTRSQPNQHH
ncbi:MAG: NAD-dependent epimerase/dehydratase family protein [Gammaproteobacteria bacterium]|nr:NAD-dependent epimerase/dehydratase family protein [Gammaproteobacteria bacterium]